MRKLWVVFLSSSLFCGVFDVVKKFDLDHKAHGYKSAETVYMINLDQRPEKWEKSASQLKKYGVRPYRFSAVNGWELSLSEINKVGCKLGRGMKRGELATKYVKKGKKIKEKHVKMRKYGETFFVHCMARGTIGIALSHLSVIKHAYDAGQNLVWIMEDDIHVKQHPERIFRAAYLLDRKYGKGKWDFLFTDADFTNANGGKTASRSYDNRRPDFCPENPDRFKRRDDIGHEVMQVGARFGMTSYLITRQGMKKIIDHYKKHNIYFPIDIEFSLPNDIRIFSLKEDVITNLADSLSDNGGANYEARR